MSAGPSLLVLCFTSAGSSASFAGVFGYTQLVSAGFPAGPYGLSAGSSYDFFAFACHSAVFSVSFHCGGGIGLSWHYVYGFCPAWWFGLYLSLCSYGFGQACTVHVPAVDVDFLGAFAGSELISYWAFSWCFH